MRNHQGFTLIELMVTISVAAIILAIAVPSMQTLRADTRIAGVANELAADLKKARNQAVIERRNQTFSAIDTSVATNIWGNKGWQLTQTVAGASKVVFKNQTMQQGVVVTGTPNSIVFVAATGMVQTVTGNTVNMTFRVCDSQITKETGFDVSINPFGRVFVQKHANSTICNT